MGNPVEDYVDCYQNLANAIVLQAVRDYEAVLRRLMRNPRNQDAQREKKRLHPLHRFFIPLLRNFCDYSQNYCMLR